MIGGIQTHDILCRELSRLSGAAAPDGVVLTSALMAHLGAPDMRHAIGYALNWPARRALPVARLDLAALGRLTFSAPDEIRFPALRIAREVMALGGTAGAAFNAAKEAALDRFIGREIGFMEMARLVEDVLTEMSTRQGLGNVALNLDNVMQTDREARALATLWAR